MSVRSKLDRFVGAAMLDEEDPAALGLLRITLVAVMTASLLVHVGSVSDYFSSHATLGGDSAREAFHSRWSLFFFVAEPWQVRAVFAVGVAAHLLWLVGLYTRVASLVAWFVWISMVGRQPLLYALPDQLHTAFATLLMVMPAGRGLSLDARWRGKQRPVPVWCRRVIQLQIAVVYVSTGVLKSGETWKDGTALYYALVNPYNRHFEIDRMLALAQPWVLRPATWVVLVWEAGFGGFLVLHWLRELLGKPRRFPDLRKGFLVFGVLMHIGIQSMLYVAWFTPLMVASYAAFLTPDEVRRFGAWLRRRRKGARGAGEGGAASEAAEGERASEAPAAPPTSERSDAAPAASSTSEPAEGS